MKKIAPDNLPSNLKTSRQNIDEVGRTSQGAPTTFIPREKKFLAKAKAKKGTKKDEYTLKDAMKRVKH